MVRLKPEYDGQRAGGCAGRRSSWIVPGRRSLVIQTIWPMCRALWCVTCSSTSATDRLRSLVGCTSRSGVSVLRTAAHPSGGVGPDTQHVGLRTPASCGELGVTIADAGRATNDVLEKMPIRSGHVQHEVADGIRLLVRTPPHVVLAQDLETFLDLAGKLRDQSRRDVLQQKGVDRIGHLVMISSNRARPAAGTKQR